MDIERVIYGETDMAAKRVVCEIWKKREINREIERVMYGVKNIWK